MAFFAPLTPPRLSATYSQLPASGLLHLVLALLTLVLPLYLASIRKRNTPLLQTIPKIMVPIGVSSRGALGLQPAGAAERSSRLSLTCDPQLCFYALPIVMMTDLKRPGRQRLPLAHYLCTSISVAGHVPAAARVVLWARESGRPPRSVSTSVFGVPHSRINTVMGQLQLR
jgi:hypothetical protein